MSKIKIYKASAGSGKTYTLTLEYIKCLLLSIDNNYFQFILVVSFTKDATNEIRERILAELYGLAMNTNDSKQIRSSLQTLLKEEGFYLDEKLINKKAQKIFQAIIYNYRWLNITTIDSFFQRIVRNLTSELRCGSQFSLEMNTQRVLQEAIVNVIEKVNIDNQLFDWLKIYIEYLMDEGKNWNIEKSMEIFGKCIYDEFFQENKKHFLEKSFLLKKLVEDQKQIQKKCQFFFEKTNYKIKILLEKYQFNENDFIQKGSCNPIRFFQKLGNGEWKDCLKKSKILNKCCSDKNAWVIKTHKRKKAIIILADVELIPLLKNTFKVLKKMNTARIILNNLHKLGLIDSIMKEIEKENHKQNRFMLSDTNLFLHQMIDNNDVPFIYEKMGSQIKHIMIDEFQDISRLQWKNFRVLLNEILARNTFSLIVGDEKQSIYRWRNSHWHILQGASNELDAEEKSLLYNWRSEKHIVNFNNMFFTSTAKMLNNISFTIYDFDKVKQKVKKNGEKGYVFVQFIKKYKKEKKEPLEQMHELVFKQLKILYDKGVLAKDICLLLRKNETINILAEYLLDKKNENPKMAEKHYLTIISNEAFYLRNSLAIKIIITSLKLIISQNNEIHKEQLLFLLNAGELEAQELIIDLLLSMPLFELIGYICSLFELERLSGQSAYLFIFYDYLNQYLLEYPATVHHFLDHWQQEGYNITIPTGTGLKGIRAMTIHQSKGLQFSTVIIPYCDWNLSPVNNPLIWCKSPKNIEEIPILPITYKKEMQNSDFAVEYEKETIQSYIDNLNLLYVAFTRAEQNLIILVRLKKGIKEKNRVSDLLQLFVKQVDKYWDKKNNCLKIGKISLPNLEKKNIDNPLKQSFKSQEIKFSLVLQEKIKFKQNNQSNRFVMNETVDIVDFQKDNANIKHGNIMHYLFEQINSMDDIEKAVNNGIIRGLILFSEKYAYIKKIRQSIKLSKVEDWFNSQHEIYRECTIISEENGIVINKRPDRIIIYDNKVIIIDYKFGEPHFFHEKQLRQYIDLLIKMNYSKIEAYLWYVEKNQVKKI